MCTHSMHVDIPWMLTVEPIKQILQDIPRKVLNRACQRPAWATIFKIHGGTGPKGKDNK